MSAQTNAARKTLAVALAAALAAGAPTGAAALPRLARSVAAVPRLSAPRVGAPVLDPVRGSWEGVSMPRLIINGAARPRRPVFAVRAVAPLATALAPAELPAVKRVLDELQARGLPESFVTREDAALLLAAAQALPGGKAREELTAMAQAINAAGNAGGLGGEGFDGAAQRAAASSSSPSGKRGKPRGALSRPAAPEDFELGWREVRFVPSPALLRKSAAKPLEKKRVVGQDNAREGVVFGVKMRGRQQNLVVSGPKGSGKKSLVREELPAIAAAMDRPNDHVAVTNFKNRDKPVFLDPLPGQGRLLERTVKKFVSAAKTGVAKALESEELAAADRKEQNEADAGRAKEIEELNVLAVRVELGGGLFHVKFVELPMKDGTVRVVPVLARQGEALDQEKVAALIAGGLTDEARVQAAVAELDGVMEAHPEFGSSLRAMTSNSEQRVQAARERMAKRRRAAAGEAIETLARELRAFAAPSDADAAAEKTKVAPEQAKVAGYVESLIRFSKANYQIFIGQGIALSDGEEEDEVEAGAPHPVPGQKPVDAADFFVVSVLADNGAIKGRPVVWVKNPTYDKIFGTADDNWRILPNGTMIQGDSSGGPRFKPGAIHRARHGFLVLEPDVDDIMAEPRTWLALMAYRRTGEAEIAEGGLEGLRSGHGKLYHVPAETKLVIFATPAVRALLFQLEKGFAANFQIVAEFEPTLDAGPESIAAYVQFIRHSALELARELKRDVMEITEGAMSAIVEHGAALADSNRKLTAQFGPLYQLIREALLWAEEAGHRELSRDDVEAALQAKERREGVYVRRLRQAYERGAVHAETSGAVVGQINALAVLGEGGPGVIQRTTARAFAGRKGVVAIDQSAQLLGSIATKATLNISGILAAEIGEGLLDRVQLQLSYEQSYDGVEGDSASMAQDIVALSALSGVPIKQSLAITGSLDALARAQPVGGVKKKIKAFFLLAQARGLTGAQGVVIPRLNVANLQLDSEIVKAIRPRNGKFHVYAVDDLRQAAELMTGVSYDTLIRKARAGARRLAREAGWRPASRRSRYTRR